MMLFSKKRKFGKLVFIVGCPRSGTSWTWGLLSSFTKVEPLLIEDFPFLAKRNKIKKMKTGRGFVTTETTIFHRDLSDRQIRRGISSKSRQYPDFILLEKTPANALKLGRITNLFPEAKIIHVFRDPRAVINSMLQSKLTGGHKVASALGEAIAKYRRYFEATIPYCKYPNLVPLRYESLSRDTTGELNRICDFIGLKPRPGEIDAVVKMNTGKAQTVSSNDFRRGKVDSYKKELDEQAISRIEEELSDVFETYGYDIKKGF